MGIYERDYYQEQRPAGLDVSGQWSMVGKLIALNVAVFVLDIIANQRLMDWLAASPNSLAEPWRIWQLLTYGFAHDNQSVGHIFWNMFGLFIFGRAVEGVYGGKEFLRIYLTTIVLGGLAWAVHGMLTIPTELWSTRGAAVVGASGAVTAVVLLFCLHFPKQTILLMFVLPVPAWAVGMLVIVVNVLGLIGPESRTAYDVHLVGAAFAICYFKFGWRLGRWLPSFSASSLTAARQWFKPRPKLKLHEPEVRYHDKDAEADELLAKVRRDGIDSLTARERSTLEDYSRRMQQKHR